ncbi:acyl-CoA thioesterase [Bernardetia sp.]|uniref:acyl-CoA thioesterase n=1 Tax=Bernardetia sp. TaxID=1937974 RepID=UPI0025C18CBB|nr:acyl-CoA thioesterase [Bernardetia sp.]
MQLPQPKHDINPLSKTEMLVRFQDCDPYGHLNNGRYIDYFLDGRDNQVTYDYGWRLVDFINEEKKGWVVQKQELGYFRPAIYGEEIVIRTATVFFDDSNLMIECRMLNKDETQLKSLLWMKLVFINLANGRRTQHTENIKEFFTKVRLNEFDATKITFDERAKELIAFYKSRRNK